MGIVSKGMQLVVTLYVHVLHQMYRINEFASGRNMTTFFSSKREIMLKVKNLSTRDVEKLFEKVKEELYGRCLHVYFTKTLHFRRRCGPYQEKLTKKLWEL